MRLAVFARHLFQCTEESHIFLYIPRYKTDYMYYPLHLHVKLSLSDETLKPRSRLRMTLAVGGM